MANMRNRSSRNGKSRNGRHNGGRRHNGSNNVINLSAAKSSHEKYIEKAKEAKSSGDRIAAENYFQFADHYKRLIIEAEERKEAQSKKDEEAESSENNTAEKPKLIDDTGDKPANNVERKTNIPQELLTENNVA